MPELVVHKRAARYLAGMDARVKAQLAVKLRELAANPGMMSGIKPMEGEWKEYFRLRHGDLRVIYLWDRVEDQIVIAHIGPRGDIYK